MMTKILNEIDIEALSEQIGDVRGDVNYLLKSMDMDDYVEYYYSLFMVNGILPQLTPNVVLPVLYKTRDSSLKNLVFAYACESIQKAPEIIRQLYEVAEEEAVKDLHTRVYTAARLLALDEWYIRELVKQE